MAANYSENKVRVVKYGGASASLGLIDPLVGMTTNKGEILSLASGNYTVIVGVGSGSTQQRFYPHDLTVTELIATGTFSYPTGDGSYAFGRASLWPSGVPDATNTKGANMHSDGIPTTYTVRD